MQNITLSQLLHYTHIHTRYTHVYACTNQHITVQPRSQRSYKHIYVATTSYTTLNTAQDDDQNLTSPPPSRMTQSSALTIGSQHSITVGEVRQRLPCRLKGTVAFPLHQVLHTPPECPVVHDILNLELPSLVGRRPERLVIIFIKPGAPLKPNC